MSTLELLSRLQKQEIHLWLDGEKLRYSAPPGRMTPDIRDEIGSQKQAIIAFLQQVVHESKVAAPPLTPIPRDQELPVSFAQERMWLRAQLEPSAGYILPALLRLQGQLDTAILQECLTEINERHESLRTTITRQEDRLIQIIHEPRPVLLPLTDLRHLSAAEREMKVRAIAAEEVRRPIDLAQGPLFWARLLQINDNEHILLTLMHHIIYDGWSLSVFTKELSVLYKVFLNGMPSPLIPLTIQYADFAYWQRQWLQGEVLESQLSYWKEQLGDTTGVLEFPTDRPRAPVQTYNGSMQFLTIPQKLAAKIKTLSHREDVTLFMISLAALQTLLYRYSRQDDIIIGIPIANRNRTEIEDLIGFFANTLALRVRFRPHFTFRELLQQVRQVALAGYAHQDIPFERIVEAINPPRDLSRQPIFQVFFNQHDNPLESISLPGLEVTALQFEDAKDRSMEQSSGVALMDLAVQIWENGEELDVWLTYNTDLFSATTAARLLANFYTLLNSIVTEPDTPVSMLDLLTEQDRVQLLTTWNNTAVSIPPFSCLHGQFEKQVVLTPDHIALIDKQHSLTYAQLNQQANQLARCLEESGVGLESPVGIFMERSTAMIVALLAVLKVGGAYLPLDPSFPKLRIEHMLSDAKPAAVITQESLRDKLPAHSGETFVWEEIELVLGQYNGDNLSVSVAPENLAYQIYTSGSTGRPKGVQIPHIAIVNFLSSMQAEPGLTAKDTLLAVTTLSFDIAGLEIFLPLIVGGKVWLVDQATAVNGQALLARLRAVRPTVMQATPATWRMLLTVGWNSSDLPMKILCGGEALPGDLAEALLARGSSVWNMYGPTETTIWSALHPVTNSGQQATVPIGRPIANTEIYILDDQLQPVPIGVWGNLMIGGAGLARGYRGQAGLSAERFLPHPFSQRPGARLYQTGDIARFLPDGVLEFGGRSDEQVKVRGYRIELGEIEAVLHQHPTVRETAVAIREDNTGEKYIVAYVVTTNGQPVSVDLLRTFLTAHLPTYMLPAKFVFLEGLPLTDNGKINRQLLPVPESERPEMTVSFVSPRSSLERTIADIWQQALNIEQIGIHDNFFDLGGYSLLMVRTQAQLQTQLDREIPIIDLFQYTTIASLADHLSQQEELIPSFSDLRERANLQNAARQRNAARNRTHTQRAK